VYRFTKPGQESRSSAIDTIDVLTDGRTSLNRIIDCIVAAETSVGINMFIWRDDPAGNRVGRALLDAANRGVDIVIAKDKLGALFELGEEGRQSFFHKESDFPTAVRQRAINIVSSTPDFFSRVIQQSNDLVDKLREHRNVTIFDSVVKNDHSKYTIIDGEVLFVGGMNFEERSVSTDANGLVWRDYLFECQGRRFVSKLQDRFRGRSRGQSSFEFVLNDNSENERFEIKTCVIDLLNGARKSCHIEMAYVGDPTITDCLVDAVNRGVDTHIIIPASANIQNELNLKTMRELFERTEGRASIYLSPDMLHAKMMDIDEQFILVGSANFNVRALNQFAELDILISGENACVRSIRRTFLERRDASKKVVAAEDLHYRKVKQWCEYVFG